ncbi:MAG: HEAT repeat domain-containing protein [Lentisphaeraceae bacterium]|nr:HEAT repeat domain-containing protein [Lentisphaeraceae bacterium]
MIRKTLSSLLFSSFLLGGLCAEEKKVLTTKEYEEKAQVRFQNYKLPEGFKAELWADESQTINPAAISFDSQGRLFVTEINRWRNGVDDIRSRHFMLMEDIQINSNAERLEMFKKHTDKFPLSYYTKAEEKIRLLEDTNGDGRADSSKFFATGFNDPLDGPGMGVIERDGKVYYTNIPHLWMLEDTDGDGVSDKKTSLQEGFGIRMSISGHDLHGLVWGPDGKLYFSVGDRGYSFTTKEGKTFHGPNEGAAFRCDPDGSNMEVFFDRLRNPQELQFDDYGNLFTADNDGDFGDLESIKYLVEGGDAGWHAGHQALGFFAKQYDYRSVKYAGKKKPLIPWLVEDLWKVKSDKHPAYLFPGVGQIEGGPSGFLFNPSNSLGKKYDDKFFVIHFRGSTLKSSISMFNVEDAGAGFKTVNHESFFKGSNCVDVEFGPDGKLYISDYNYGGWTNQNVGNIVTLSIPEELQKKEVKENQTYLVSDFSKIPSEKLLTLLSRDHQQIRLRAQFESAKRSESRDLFLKLAQNTTKSTFERIHAIWGLGMVAKDDVTILESIFNLLNDENEQVRIQTARVLGDRKVKTAVLHLIKALTDTNARVGMYAGIGLGRIQDASALEPLIAAVAKNNDQDVFLRHGLVMGLAGMTDQKALVKYTSDKSESVRLAVLLAMRRHKNPQLKSFLKDKSEKLVYEAIRAINDLAIVDAQPELAAMLPSLKVPTTDVEKLIHLRVMNANYYVGDESSAKRLLEYAARTDLPQSSRREALAVLQAWQDKFPLDATTSLPRAFNKKRIDLKESILAKLGPVLENSKGELLAQANQLAVDYSFPMTDEILVNQVLDKGLISVVRLGALDILTKRKSSKLKELSFKLIQDKSADIRSKALELLFIYSPKNAFLFAKRIVKSGQVKDRQNVYKQLASIDASEAKLLLMSAMQNILDGKGDKEAMLEIVEASMKRQESEVKGLVLAYEKSISGATPVKKHEASLFGGDIDSGKDIFMNNGTVQCIRCHKVNGFGADVGPDLSAIGKEQSLEYLLEAIVDPGATVAKGFGAVTMTLKNGTVVSGILLDETKQGISLKQADGKIKIYQVKEVQSKQKPISGMPPMAMLMKPAEVRDIVAYLASLKKAVKKKAVGH